MWSASRHSLIVFNGEIYNYQELRKRLAADGRSFVGYSDTEVILNAYETWGIEKTLEALDGMFAFGIWDVASRRLILARDRFGKKPLYYHLHGDGGTLSFGSDIRSLQVLSREQLSLDYHALGYYLAELSTPQHHSIWKEIKKLEAGSYATVTFKDSRIHLDTKAYWCLVHSGDCSLAYEEIVECTAELIQKAVRKRLVADVRVAALLSGGVDSSLVVAAMARLSADAVNTYTVGYKGHTLDESGYARQVAGHFGTHHTELFIEPFSLDSLDNLIYEYGEPFADSSMIPSYLISKQISQFEKVVLGGDGGDEFFGGYDSYYKVFKLEKVRQFRRFEWAARLLAKFYPGYRTKLLYELVRKANAPAYRLLNRDMAFRPSEIEQLLGAQAATEALDIEHRSLYDSTVIPSRSDLLRVINASLKTRLINDYLVKVDRASMYASLEMRSPMLDKDLAAFAATLKPAQIYAQGEPKAILKSILLQDFPESFVNRKKMGFGFPVADQFAAEFSKVKESILDNTYPFDLNRDFVLELLDSQRSGNQGHTHKIFALFVLSKWVRINQNYLST